jgi:dGTPase
VKSDWEYFYRKRKEIQRSTAKEWQDLIDFEGNANGFTVLTGSRPGIEGGLRISFATLGDEKYQRKVYRRNQQPISQIKKYGFSN